MTANNVVGDKNLEVGQFEWAFFRCWVCFIRSAWNNTRETESAFVGTNHEALTSENNIRCLSAFRERDKTSEYIYIAPPPATPCILHIYEPSERSKSNCHTLAITQLWNVLIGKKGENTCSVSFGNVRHIHPKTLNRHIYVCAQKWIKIQRARESARESHPDRHPTITEYNWARRFILQHYSAIAYLHMYTRNGKLHISIYQR